MIARGPTLTTDRATWTGSMHIVDLPDAQAARVFAFREPDDRAGVYGEVLVRRWRNALGRTMWDHPAEPGDDRRFLVIGRGKPGVEAARQALEAAQRRWFGEPGHRDGFILRGPLLSDDGAGWVGSALLVQLGDRPLWRPCWPARPMCRPGCMRAWRSTTGSSAGATKADAARAWLAAASSSRWCCDGFRTLLLSKRADQAVDLVGGLHVGRVAGAGQELDPGVAGQRLGMGWWQDACLLAPDDQDRHGQAAQVAGQDRRLAPTGTWPARPRPSRGVLAQRHLQHLQLGQALGGPLPVAAG